MVPIYTGILTTEEYGIADLIATTTTLLIPFLTLSIIEACIRYCLAGSDDKKEIFSSTTFVLSISAIMALFLKPPLSYFSSNFEILKTLHYYFWYFWIYFVVTITEEMLFKFAKGIERVKICAGNAVVVVFSTVLLNILFLIVFKFGLRGYLIAIILSKLISALYLFLSISAYKYFSIKKINHKITKDMLSYSIPFIPTACAWWINMASDRYVVTALCGIAANGLYSMSNRIPSLLSVFTSIFQQAWQISGVKEYKENDYKLFFSKIYNSYVIFIGISCSVIIIFSPTIAKFLFKNDFYVAWKFTPFLLLGTVFSGISGVLAPIFHAEKKNGQLAISTFFGAVINLGMNILFVETAGPIGAAVSTVISFCVVWGIRFYTAQRLCKFEGKLLKSIILFSLIFVESYVMSFEINGMFVWSSIILTSIFFLYYKDIRCFMLFAYDNIKRKFKTYN